VLAVERKRTGFYIYIGLAATTMWKKIFKSIKIPLDSRFIICYNYLTILVKGYEGEK
jgi:hypothetical protein